jgi:hypothetical protein
MATQPNPLLGSWPGTSGVNMPTPGVSQGDVDYTHANLPRSDKNLRKEAGRTNIVSGRLRNLFGPEFAKLMMGYGGDAGSFYKQLTDLGSPFYERKQQKTAEQGAKAGQDEAGLARQRLTASGAGYGPSGAGAAMFGGMGQAQAGNQEEAFLNNLFQNELLQLQGAQGQAQLASLFNPTGMLGGNVEQISRGPSAAQNFATTLGALSGLFKPKG